MKNRIRFFTQLFSYLLVCAFTFSSLYGIAIGEEYTLRDNLRAENIRHGKQFRLDLERIREIISVQKRHSKRLMDTWGVFATATGISRDGEPVLKVFTSRAETAGIPASIW